LNSFFCSSALFFRFSSSTFAFASLRERRSKSTSTFNAMSSSLLSSSSSSSFFCFFFSFFRSSSDSSSETSFRFSGFFFDAFSFFASFGASFFDPFAGFSSSLYNISPSYRHTYILKRPRHALDLLVECRRQVCILLLPDNNRVCDGNRIPTA
jgi:hypothetical protein